MKPEEIVGYLPHGLTGTAKEYDGTQYFAELTGIFKDCGEISFIDIDEVEGLLDNQSPTYHRGFLVDFKPILKTELSEGESIEVHKRLYPNHWHKRTKEYLIADVTDDLNNETLMVAYMKEFSSVIQYLYSIHYDIHGFVERGEAIDIKTLKYE